MRDPNDRRQLPPGSDPPLQEGLADMATIGAQTVLWLMLAAGVGCRPWPSPSSSSGRCGRCPSTLSERVKRTSPFDVEFWLENSSAWFAMSRRASPAS